MTLLLSSRGGLLSVTRLGIEMRSSDEYSLCFELFIPLFNPMMRIVFVAFMRLLYSNFSEISPVKRILSHSNPTEFCVYIVIILRLSWIGICYWCN
mmetsp:Transcript_5380/g.9476  ORF Transcript_5380/g.9476 Transcript_5380/m.9476 type:complete len:96 (-) Transcript_5380:64-351(-)